MIDESIIKKIKETKEEEIEINLRMSISINDAAFIQNIIEREIEELNGIFPKKNIRFLKYLGSSVDINLGYRYIKYKIQVI